MSGQKKAHLKLPSGKKVKTNAKNVTMHLFGQALQATMYAVCNEQSSSAHSGGGSVWAAEGAWSQLGQVAAQPAYQA